MLSSVPEKEFGLKTKILSAQSLFLLPFAPKGFSGSLSRFKNGTRVILCLWLTLWTSQLSFAIGDEDSDYRGYELIDINQEDVTDEVTEDARSAEWLRLPRDLVHEILLNLAASDLTHFAQLNRTFLAHSQSLTLTDRHRNYWLSKLAFQLNPKISGVYKRFLSWKKPQFLTYRQLSKIHSFYMTRSLYSPKTSQEDPEFSDLYLLEAKRKQAKKVADAQERWEEFRRQQGPNWVSLNWNFLLFYSVGEAASGVSLGGGLKFLELAGHSNLLGYSEQIIGSILTGTGAGGCIALTGCFLLQTKLLSRLNVTGQRSLIHYLNRGAPEEARQLEQSIRNSSKVSKAIGKEFSIDFEAMNLLDWEHLLADINGLSESKYFKQPFEFLCLNNLRIPSHLERVEDEEAQDPNEKVEIVVE